MDGRSVKKVLVMLDYGPEDPASGEVYDVTALLAEMPNEKQEYVSLHLEMTGFLQTWGEEKGQVKMTVSWRGYGGMGGTGASGHLADVINTSLPDDERVLGLKKRLQKCRKACEKAGERVKEAKIEQVAAVRHLHPIARISESPLALVSGESGDVRAGVPASLGVVG